MTDPDPRYRLRLAERTTVELPPGRRLRVLDPQDGRETLGPLGEPVGPGARLLPFGDVELQVDRDGDRIVLWVVGLPLLVGSLDEAAGLADVLRSIVGRP